MKELNLKVFLKEYKNQYVDFFRFPGNYGDSFIWHGTKKILSLFNIKEKYVSISSPKYYNILFIDGGGNLVDYYSDVKNFLTKKANLYKKIIILPHTISGEKQLEVLNDVSGKLTIFCREKISAKFLKNNLIKPDRVYLWHDCAFYNIFPLAPYGKRSLNVFRLDKESALKKIPGNNIDLSSNGYAKKPLNELINFLKKYKKINTDRLHIAIAATLLGKRVKLFANSYYKNEAVFNYSLRKFRNINFVKHFNNKQ